jgi:DNA-binding SARP family transcriptional activator
MMAQTGIGFGILGPLEMCVNDTVVPLGTPKQRAVLAMLVIRRNHAVGTDELFSAAWGMHAPKRARDTLYTYVFNLRRLMDRPGIDAHAVLASAPPGYRLVVPDTECDHGRFMITRRRGAHAAADGRFEEASRLLSAALEEWRGPALDDLRDFPVFDTFIAALSEDKLMTQIARAEAEIACGRPLSVLNELKELTDDHPYREPLWAQLITAHYVAGHQSEALDAYHRLKSALADDLGIYPGQAVSTLIERILRQEPLDVGKAAQSHAEDTVNAFHEHVTVQADHIDGPVLHDADGSTHPLLPMSTRIGRSLDNNIVLADRKVSRHHAAIIDTGTSFVIADLRSINGVYVAGRRIHTSATLSNGDVIRIGDHTFTFESTSK